MSVCAVVSRVRGAVGAALGVERRIHLAHDRPKSLQHAGDHVVPTDQDPFAVDLSGEVAVAEVPGEAEERGRIPGAHLEQGFGAREDFNDPSILKFQSVAGAEQNGLPKVEEADGSVICGDDDPTAVTRVVVEGGVIRRVPPRARGQDVDDALQNRKYLCAMGNTSAGAQVRSSPSARTS